MTTDCSRKATGSGGFTLLEVLITMVVVSITLAGVLLLQGATWRSTASTNNIQLAGQLVERRIEEMRLAISFDTTMNWPPVDGGMNASGLDMNWAVSKTKDPDGAYINRVRQVDFTVAWRSTVPETLKVTTFLSKDF
jgi:prepilin-type N-terminal cleavage/methylation domain-containing protein